MAQDIRPHYHLTPPLGWMNDPNGLICIDGLYHAFYQYHPLDTVWGPMHWGHAISYDLCLWQHLPIALTPHSDYDRMGCFSGTALYEDGVLSLMYTGNTETGQHQCLAKSTDFIHFDKWEGNPVLSAKSLPCHINPMHLRDPKILKDKEFYYMLCGGQSIHEKGLIAVFKSQNLTDWHYHFTLDDRHFDIGPIWECPDLVTLFDENAQSHHLLIFSPQGTAKLEALHMPNLHSAVYALGDVHLDKGHAELSQPRLLDEGFDFYAPQTLLGPKGQVLMIGWLDMWESENLARTGNLPWAGSLSFPRELRLFEGQLIQQPFEGILKYRKDLCSFSGLTDFSLEDSNLSTILGPVFDPCYDLELTIRPLAPSQSKTQAHSLTQPQMQKLIQTEALHQFEIHFTESLFLVYDPSSLVLTLHRGSETRSIAVSGESLNLRILSDVTSVEIFIQGGKSVMSSKLLRDPALTSVGGTEGFSLKLCGKGLWQFDQFALYTLEFPKRD